jgi:hypothetical protein
MFNAASDWVGSCAITIKRRLDRTPQSRGSGSARKPRTALCCPLSQLSRCGKLDRPMNYRFFLPLQFFGHTRCSACGPMSAVWGGHPDIDLRLSLARGLRDTPET